MIQLTALKIPKALAHAMLYGFSIALMKGLSLLMLPFIANCLSSDDFGRLEVISSFAIIGSILIGLGLEDALFRYAGTEKSLAVKRSIAAKLYTLTLSVSVLTLIIAALIPASFGSALPASPSDYELRLVLYLLAFEGCIAVPLGWLRMNNRVFLFFNITVGRAFVQASLVYVFLSNQQGVAGILEASLIAAAIQAAILAYIQIKDTGLSLKPISTLPLFSYCGPIVFSGLLAFSLNGFDRWILSEQHTLTDVAHFSVASKFALAVVLLMQPFGMWWSPKRFEILSKLNGAKKSVEFITLGLTLTLIITVSIGLLSPILVKLLLPDNYQISGQYALVLVLAMCFKEMSELVNIGCFTGDSTQTQLYVNAICALIGVALMLCLTPHFSVWGIVIALLITQFSRLLLLFNASQYFLPLAYPIRTLVSHTLFAIFWLLLGLQTSNMTEQISLAIIGPCCMALAAIKMKSINITSLKQQACQ